MKENNAHILGQTAYVSIPEFGVRAVLARVDTGALRGAIHARIIGVVSEHGREVLKFTVLDETHPEFADMVFTAHDFEVKKVRSSHGHVRERYSIPVRIVIDGVSVDTKIGLSDRKKMHYAILLGRKALAGKFLVDVSIPPVRHPRKARIKK